MILKAPQNVNSEKLKTMCARRIPITELNDLLTCKLCKGYFIDATTIIECLHSFCRSCIVKYLEKNRYCPVCDVQVHKTKPLLNIRPDKTLQDIVYKLVPRLFQNEMCRRREYYSAHPEARPTNLEQCGEASYQHILSPDETICLSVNYHESGGTPRYLRCPAALSVAHLQKLIRAKYDLSEQHRIDILYNQDCLNSHLTLMDIAYIYLWRRKGPLELTYRIYENQAKRLKVEEGELAVVEKAAESTSSDWKEVQLRISENGEICVTGINDSFNETKPAERNEVNSDAVVEASTIKSKKDLPALKYIGKNPVATTSATLTSPPTTVLSKKINSTTCVASNHKSVEKNGKHKLMNSPDGEPVVKQPKQTILNHSLGLHGLSNNHPLKRHSQTRPEAPVGAPVSGATNLTTPVFTKPIVINKNFNHVPLSRPSTPIITSQISQNQKWPPNKSSTPGPPCYTPKLNYTPINVPKVPTIPKPEQKPPTTTQATNPPPVATTSQSVPTGTLPNNRLALKPKPGVPMGYKTLRDPPKTWNPQVSRASLQKSDVKCADLKNVRPAKFFKMRNMPRYLGNPASGVKPMYQVQCSPEKDKTDKIEIKKHSIVKVDPKTLKPISEKAPETTSLSNQSDLKINTSSVPIFNPLKLQSSPKGERKSPKSPHSPKPKSSSPPSKREKVNLNFTPPNPFIPNLTSPTINPNQFLYPSGHPGFPYDARMMAAAYHSMIYGQRMPFPTSPLPGLNLDLNQRKFDLPPTSPKLMQGPTPMSPKLQTALKSGVKKTNKESGKNEKSLQNAVEKLTQNRVKENNKKTELLLVEKKLEKAEEKVETNGDVEQEKQKEAENKQNSTKQSEIEKQETPEVKKTVDKDVSNNNVDSLPPAVVLERDKSGEKP